MRTSLTLICLTLSFTLFACSDDAGQANNGGWDIGTGTDAGSDAATDVSFDTRGGDTGDDADVEDTWGYDGGTANYEVVFELKNESGRPIFAHQQIAGMPCAWDGNHWLSVEQSDGSGVRLSDDCSVCNCDETDDCSVCAYDCPGPPSREWTELGDDESRSYTWDGRIWRTHVQGCEMPHFAVDQTLEAEFCWGTGFDDAVSEITGYRCMTVDFELTGARQVVQVTVPERDTHDITFRMINDTGGDLYAQPSGATDQYSCYGNWYSVGNGDEAFALAKPCGVCDCSEVGANPEETCQRPCPAVSCAAPTEEVYRLPAGTQRSDVWDGSAWEFIEVNNEQCAEPLSLPDELVATFCYAEEVIDQGSYASLGTTTCQQISFDRLADDEVVLRIE